MTLIKKFEIKLFNGSELKDEADYHWQGEGDAWRDYQQLRIAGFDGSVCVSLEDIWQRIQQQQETEFISNVTGYETIVKFGNSMQLKTPFVIKIQLTYN